MSNLPFLSKVLERVIHNQNFAYLDENNLLSDVQSAYKRDHSTETVLLKLFSDLIDAMDSGQLQLPSLPTWRPRLIPSIVISHVGGCPRPSKLHKSRCNGSFLKSRIECSQCFSRVKTHHQCPTGFGFRAATFYFVHCGHLKSYPGSLSFTLQLV